MDYIYSKLNNNLVDINRISGLELLECVTNDEPVKGLTIGDYYLKLTVVDSNSVVYCPLSKINDDIRSLQSRVKKLEEAK